MNDLQLLIGCLLTAVTIFNIYFAFHHTSSQTISICLDNLNFFLDDGKAQVNNDVAPKLRTKVQKHITENNQKQTPINKPKASPIIDEKVRKGINLAAATGSSVSLETTDTSGFVRHDNVAIVTKIHGEHQWSLVEQSLCLLHYAYNHKVLYDIIIFSTDPVSEENIQSLKDILSPAKVNLVVDNKGLQQEIADLDPSRYAFLQKLCNTTDTSQLNWFSECEGNRLAYNWQAEFRGKRLWHHPSLAKYKTALWMDTDGFPSQPWEKDPVDYFIKNEGVIMFDHFPQAHSKFYVQKGIYEGFNATLCKLTLAEEGNLVAEYGTVDKCRERGVPNIHGFLHITNLDFYRSKQVTFGLDKIFGDCFLCRQPDDQLAVTAPAAMLAPDKSWEMRSKGFHLNVFHNSAMDGIDKAKPPGFIKYWEQKGKQKLPAAAGVCKVVNMK